MCIPPRCIRRLSGIDGKEYYTRIMERDILSRSPSETMISVIDRRTLGGEEEVEDALSSCPWGNLHPSGESLRAQPILTL